MQFKQIPAFTDNYLWVIANEGQAWVVDPGDSAPIISYLEQENTKLKGILITHHHQDHIGGVEKLMDYSKKQGSNPIQILGPSHPQIKHLTRVLSEGDSVELFGDQILEVYSVPGHTLSHIAYFLPVNFANPIPRLYCGDTLFSAGCGRLFEGSADQMYDSLMKFSKLPDETLVCCAHEYTLANLKFAKFLDPANDDLVKWINTAEQLRIMNQPTVPTTIGLEKKVNPFLRCDQDPIIAAAKNNANQTLHSPIDVLRVIRTMKDSF